MKPRSFPASTPRVESGPIRFGDDWPGIFIRGDHALMALAPHVRKAEELLRMQNTLPAEIDELCQAGLNSSDPKHWEAALQDIMAVARRKPEPTWALPFVRGILLGLAVLLEECDARKFSSDEDEECDSTS